MRQVLFEIPGLGLPIFGYGFMLMLAFLVGITLANRRAQREGINPEHIWDVALPVFIGSLIGARLLSRIMEPEEGNWWTQILKFFEIWRGGMILYGAAPGAILGYVWAYYRTLKPNKLSPLRVADIIAPVVALGLFFGRIGCFLNGCCWGDVADPVTAAWVEPLGQAAQFPANSPPHRRTVEAGYQLAYGFRFSDLGERADDPRTIREVEPNSRAWDAGLRPGDVIVKVGDADTPFLFADNLGESVLGQLANWPINTPLQLTVRRDGASMGVSFDPPRSLPLIPTQLLSALDGVVLFILLTAFYPFRRRAGEVIALLTLVMPINRFFIEKLRMDNPPEWFGMTLSQNISIGLFLFGVALWFYVRRRNVPVDKPVALGEGCMSSPFQVAEEVDRALRVGRPIVALESALITHGLPPPSNLTTARAAEAAVRAAGAVPATIAVVAGVVRVGLDEETLTRLAQPDSTILKASRRDLAMTITRGKTAGVTVAGASSLANRVGIQVFATGGIGGVHRGAAETFDISADLIELARTPVFVVCSGAKSILDIPRTLEMLETLGVAVVGYGVDEFPAFYVRSSGERLDARVDTAEEAARLARAHWNLAGAGIILAQPPPREHALDPQEHANALAEAEGEARSRGVRGKELTPFLLSALAKLTNNKSLRVNQELVVANARLAAQVARCLSRGAGS